MSAPAERSLPGLREWFGGAEPSWPPVRSLADGDALRACFHLDSLDQALTRHEKPYLRLRLSDRHGSVEGRVWEDAERVMDRIRPGSFVGIRGRVQVYRGEHQLRVDEIVPLRVETAELGLFMPRSARDPDEMEAELAAFIASVSDPPLRQLLERVLGPETDTGRRFRQAPAAKRNHHAYVGGLLEHTLSLAAICDFLAGHYGDAVDRELLMAGALLHDLGKIRELGLEAGFPYTDEGKLLGHILIGIQIVAAEADAVPELEAGRRNLLLHLIASHQGRYEWQSPREPLTLEALLLHHADDLDAKMAQAASLVDGVDEGWSAYSRSFAREFLRHPHGEPAGGQGEAGSGRDHEDDAGPDTGPPAGAHRSAAGGGAGQDENGAETRSADGTHRPASAGATDEDDNGAAARPAEETPAGGDVRQASLFAD